MTEEERKDNLPETGPEEGVDRLGQDLGDTADSVTRELRDLQDEMLPTPVEPDEPAQMDVSAASDAGPGRGAGRRDAGFDPRRACAVQGRAEQPDIYARGHGRRPADVDAGLAVPGDPATADRFGHPVAGDNTKDRPFQRHHAVTSLSVLRRGNRV